MLRLVDTELFIHTVHLFFEMEDSSNYVRILNIKKEKSENDKVAVVSKPKHTTKLVRKVHKENQQPPKRIKPAGVSENKVRLPENKVRVPSTAPTKSQQKRQITDRVRVPIKVSEPIKREQNHQIDLSPQVNQESERKVENATTSTKSVQS